METALTLAATLLASVSALAASTVSSYFSRRTTEASSARIEVNKAELEAALKDATITVVPADPVHPPTSSGKREALALVDLYMRDLVDEASRIARRLGAEGASDVHVREAAARIGILRSRANVAADLGLAFGSIALGAALAYQINLWTGGQAAEGTKPYALGALITGVGVFVWSATTKWRQR